MKQSHKKLDLNRDFIKRFLFHFSVFSFFLFLFWLSDFLFHWIPGNLLGNINTFDMYFSQLEISFIIITLVSILSTNTQMVYWEDISQYNLLKPKHTGFADFVAYILACLFGSTIYMLDQEPHIIISFVICVALLALLTYKMIKSYFGRDSLKNKLEEDYCKLCDDMIGNGGSILRMEELSQPLTTDFKDKRNKLKENTYKAVDIKDYDVIHENIDLLLKTKDYNTYFDMMGYLSNTLPELFCEILTEHDEEFEFDTTDDRSLTILKKYYEFIHSRLIYYIKNDNIGVHTDRLFSLCFGARKKILLLVICGVDEKDVNKGMIQCCNLDDIFFNCIKEDNYEQLDGLLSKCYSETKKLIKQAHIFDKTRYKTKYNGILEKICNAEFEIEGIRNNLQKKIISGEIYGSQLCAIMRTILDYNYYINMIEQHYPSKIRDNVFKNIKKLIQIAMENKLFSSNAYTDFCGPSENQYYEGIFKEIEENCKKISIKKNKHLWMKYFKLYEEKEKIQNKPNAEERLNEIYSELINLSDLLELDDVFEKTNESGLIRDILKKAGFPSDLKSLNEMLKNDIYPA